MAIVYFPKDDLKANFPYGTTLILRSRILPMQKIGNPGQFDFAAYYARQGIYYQVFLQKGEYILLQGGKGKRFNQFLFITRNKIIRILQKNIKDKKAAGLAEALLIGYRNDLDQTLVNAYANTGVIHVIAISGLHLGLLFAVMMSLTSFLEQFPKKTMATIHSGYLPAMDIQPHDRRICISDTKCFHVYFGGVWPTDR